MTQKTKAARLQEKITELVSLPQLKISPSHESTSSTELKPDILDPGPQAEFAGLAKEPSLAQADSEEISSSQTAEAAEASPAPVEEDLEYVRVIRSLAMIVIVAEHLAFPLIYRYNEILISEWWIGTQIYIWGKAGSPLFTMVSGLLLLNPSKNNQTLQVFFTKRFMKVLIPFIGWSLIYFAWRRYWIGTQFSTQDILYIIIDGPVYYHLWFIQMILGLYLATPIIRIYTRHASRSNMSYFLIVWFISTGFFPIVKRYMGFEIGIDMYVMVGFMGYFVLGYYLRPIKLNRTQMMWCLAAVVIISLGTMLMTHFLTVRLDGKFGGFFTMNLSPNIMVMSTVFFLFMKSVDYKTLYQRRPWFHLFVKHVSSTSFGLYLVHVMLVEDFRSGRPGIQLHGMTWHPAIAIPVLTIATMFVSYLIVRRMQQIPYVRQIVP